MATRVFSSEILSAVTRSEQERFPEMFRQGPIADRHKATRVVPMRVLVFGLMRTGTSSIRIALSRMGFDHVYHMNSVLCDPDDAQWWLRAGEAKWNHKGTFTKEDWDKLLGHCQAVCDIPPAAFAEELIATYPDAKVVILNRGVDKWYTSVSQTVLRVAKPTAWSTLLGLLDWRETGQFSKMLDQQMRGMFGPAGLTEDNMKRLFIDYHENLRRIVPRERLLEYKVQDGYGPLCNFLGVPVPTREVEGKEVEEPFPRVNDSSAFMEKIAVRDRQRNRRILRKTGKFLSVVVLIGTGLWYLWGP